VEQTKFLRDQKTLGIYYCGQGDCWGLEWPMLYLNNRILDNPNLDWKAELDDFYRAAFGQAAAPMKAMYEEMHQRTDFLGTFYDDYPSSGPPRASRSQRCRGARRTSTAPSTLPGC
jgi:hypothetical protein